MGVFGWLFEDGHSGDDGNDDGDEEVHVAATDEDEDAEPRFTWKTIMEEFVLYVCIFSKVMRR